MSDSFFQHPILNSPYEIPTKHWELNENNQPTHNIINTRRYVDFFTPFPKPKISKYRTKGIDLEHQSSMDLYGGKNSENEGQYDHTSRISQIRNAVDVWRTLPKNQWQVTPITARLLEYWRTHLFGSIRPFFCQIEAVETIIWLTEVAPKSTQYKNMLSMIDQSSLDANPGLSRIAFKMATGTGKTTVMAMIIAWQTLNAINYHDSKTFTNSFLIITPGITIKDRLRVLKPSDPDSYFKTRELIPNDMIQKIERANVEIINFHALHRRENFEISKIGKSLLSGQTETDTLESNGQMVKRVLPNLIGHKNILIMNDEGHHCYVERQKSEIEEDSLTADEKKEAKEENEAARLWINGIHSVQKALGVMRVLDLSATPFFLKGSGYREGILFPWTVSDYSLMDAIESGIVKLPRIPVSDNIPGQEVPMYRELWKYIGRDMPRTRRVKGVYNDPLKLPMPLQTALEALYGHYAHTFELWKKSGRTIPPCMIVVCNNTASSKLVYDYISGFIRENEDGSEQLIPGRLPLFSNFDELGNKLGLPKTILIDSAQIESGDSLDANFRKLAADQIDRYKKDLQLRGDFVKSENISEQDLLREVMNTIGKEDKLGEQIRCVVSVSMLTEGWDANNVAYILGARAFSTQLLCEQVVGRALRRESYDIQDNGLLDVEYADILGIPFDFTTDAVIPNPKPPQEKIHVMAISPERDFLEIHFPRVLGYRIAPPTEKLHAKFDQNHILELNPKIVGATEVEQQGIIGETTSLTLKHLKDQRRSSIVMNIAVHILMDTWRDPSGVPKNHLLPDLMRIVNEWLDSYLICTEGTYPGQLMNKALADIAAKYITSAITTTMMDKSTIRATIDPYTPMGSTRYVNFVTSKKDMHWQTDCKKSHVNWAICDSTWETKFCSVIEKHPRVMAYVKNHNLGFEVPYSHNTESRKYIPDFILLVDINQTEPLNLVVEIKGYHGLDAEEKKSTMNTYWVPGVNNLGVYGRWAFVELQDVSNLVDDLDAYIYQELNKALDSIVIDEKKDN